MLSIIICSVNYTLLTKLRENLWNTTGVDYELLTFDNSGENLGICEVYNNTACKAKYPYLLFIHEDIVFYTKNWGQQLIEILDDREVGLVGMAGATFKSSAPTSWVAVPNSYYRTNQYFTSQECEEASKKMKHGYEEVAVADGMFLAIRKEVWSKCKFNECLTGFHMYDIDLSYRLKQNNYKIVIPSCFVVRHLSRGTFDIKWMMESIQWHKKKSLPIFVGDLDFEELYTLEEYSYASFIYMLVKRRVLHKKWFKYYFDYFIRFKRLRLGLLTSMLLGFCYYVGLKLSSLGPKINISENNK